MAFEFPYEYNVRSLPASYRMHNCALTNYLLYTPRNSDSYCILHSIFAGKEKLHEGKSLNKNKDYMEAFNQWFTEHNLGRFFIEGYFCLDNIELLEKELQCSVNLYTFEGEAPELFYRSSYRYDGDIFNLVIIPMKYFFDGNIRPTPSSAMRKHHPLSSHPWTWGKTLSPLKASRTWSPGEMATVRSSTPTSSVSVSQTVRSKTLTESAVTAPAHFSHTTWNHTRLNANHPSPKAPNVRESVDTARSTHRKLSRSFPPSILGTRSLFCP
jgi:hypothetical protein